ncbi:MAG: glycosyltransferase family 4 protein [Verrucomicrobiota bacterium]
MQSSLRIGMDVRLLAKRRGIGNYVHNLLEAVAASDTRHRFVLYGDHEELRAVAPADDRFEVRIMSPKIYPVWEQLALPVQAGRDGVDLLHCPANAGPLWMPRDVGLVLTVHDVMYMLPESQLPVSPSLYQRLGRAYLRRVVPSAVRHARAVLTISRYSRSDICRHLGVKAETVDVIHEAAGRTFRPLANDEAEARLRGFGLRRSFFVTLGAIDPRKNTLFTIEAFARLVAQGEQEHDLVIVGLAPKAREHFAQHLRARNLGPRVHLLGFVTEEELTALYGRATAILYPSLYEGFGIPILEGMACGTPVVGSVHASIPEIAGDAALLIDTVEPEMLTAAMARILGDVGLRRELIARGRKRAAEFSWDKLAKETLAVYERVSRPGTGIN